jgi:hypothetical protein
VLLCPLLLFLLSRRFAIVELLVDGRRVVGGRRGLGSERREEGTLCVAVVCARLGFVKGWTLVGSVEIEAASRLILMLRQWKFYNRSASVERGGLNEEEERKGKVRVSRSQV